MTSEPSSRGGVLSTDNRKKTTTTFDTMSSCGPSGPSSTSALYSLFSLPGLIFFFSPLHLKSAPSPPPPGGSNLTRSLSQSRTHRSAHQARREDTSRLLNQLMLNKKKKSMLTVESLTLSFWVFFLVSLWGNVFLVIVFFIFLWQLEPADRQVCRLC